MTKKFLLYSTPFFLAFICFSIFEPWIYQNFFASSSIHRLKNKKFEIIAHKGASGIRPENTMVAFKKALELGVDQIELDIRKTKDNHLIVFHDETLDRVVRDAEGNPVKGFVHDFTLEEIKQFEVGSWFDREYEGEKIPTLREALDTIQGKCKVLIEIKKMDHPLYHDFAQTVVEVIKNEENGEDWIIIQSYDVNYLDEVHELDSLIQTKALLVGEDSPSLLSFYIESNEHLGRAKEKNRLSALNPHWETLSPRRVFRMHARGYSVYAFPVNEREDMIKMLNAGVDGIITDFPDRLMSIKKEIARLP